MTKRLLVAAAAAGLLLAPASPAGAAIDPKANCPSGQYVVNATQTILNDASRGVAGNTWAFRNYWRTIVIVRTGNNTYCAATRDWGSYSTVAGTSPGATGAVSSGLAGSFSGGIRSNVFRATFRPSVPTTGSFGTYDYRCDASLVCPGYVDWRSLYFTNIRDYDLTWWNWTYYGGDYGFWQDYALGTAGDIVG